LRLRLEETAFDIDGVVADVITVFLRNLAERHGYTGLTTEHVTEFDLARCLGAPEAAVSEIIGELVVRPHEMGVAPYPGAAEALTELSRRGPLTFITARKKEAPMRAWFEAALPGLPRDRVIIVPAGAPEKKTAHLRARGLTALIDDHLETCEALQQEGLTAVVFDQPWNRRATAVPRAVGWPALMDMLRD
jgi:hypothetical protein